MAHKQENDSFSKSSKIDERAKSRHRPRPGKAPALEARRLCGPRRVGRTPQAQGKAAQQLNRSFYEAVTIHRPLVAGNDWLITADHPLAAQAGAAILEKGGNAVDAAIAANLVLTVVRPHMCGPGGDLFALIYWAQEERLYALNASGHAPVQATPEAYRRRGHSIIPPKGLLSATVPGAIEGWQALIERFATCSWEQLGARALNYAEEGFPVYDELITAIRANQNILHRSTDARRILLPHGKPLMRGDRLVQTALAQTLKAIYRHGARAFYEGETGRRLCAFSRAQDAFFTEEDLAARSVEWVEPLATVYRDTTLCTVPPNSQGIALLMQANLLAHIESSKLTPGSADLLHHMVEIKKLVFADRDRHVCDPRFHTVPVASLLDMEYAARRAAGVDPQRAAEQAPAAASHPGGEDTVYLAVVDRDGNAVSMIQSIYDTFGSCVMIPDTGIFLHNRGCGFTLDTAHPNCLQPGKRPYHTLHPAMVLHNGQPLLVLGSPGADGQTQTVMQLLVNLLDFDLDPQAAVEAPRWRSFRDGPLNVESRFPVATLAELRRRGHWVEETGPWEEEMGSAQIIQIDRQRGVLCGGADPRRQAYAIAR